MLCLRSDDLHLVARLELLVELYKLVVDMGGDAVVAYFRVDVVGEVEHGGVLGQGDGLAMRGEHLDLIREQVVGEGVHKVERGVALGTDQLVDALQPFVEAALSLVVGAVSPVGSEAFLSDLVHALAADLYLHPFAVVTHEDGVY